MIPKSAGEFCEILPTTTFAINLKVTINLEDRIAVILFSDKLYDLLADITNIQFDGTFYTVLKQFTNCGLFLLQLGDMQFQPFTAY